MSDHEDATESRYVLHVEVYIGFVDKTWDTETVELELSEEQFKKLPEEDEDRPNPLNDAVLELAVAEIVWSQYDDIAFYGLYHWKWLDEEEIEREFDTPF